MGTSVPIDCVFAVRITTAPNHIARTWVDPLVLACAHPRLSAPWVQSRSAVDRQQCTYPRPCCVAARVCFKKCAAACAQRHDGDGACTCPQPRAPARARRPAACMCGSSSWLLQARKFNTLGRLFCRRCVRREALRASERGEARHGAGRGRGAGRDVTRLPSHCSLGRCVGEVGGAHQLTRACKEAVT